MVVLTEQGFYFFLNRSDKPGALPLQKLVAGDILPSIRKTGRYAHPSAVGEVEGLRRALLSAKPRWDGILRGINAGYSESQIARALDCGVKTVQQDKKRMRALGLLAPVETPSRLRNALQLPLFKEAH